MDIDLVPITIRDLTEDYANNDEEGGVIGYGGKLNIRPPYQREFIYKDKQRDAVIETVVKKFPLNVMYWAVTDDGSFELIDGQQRTISICQYVDGDFSIDGRYFFNLQDNEQEAILNYELSIYQCTGSNSDKLDWFQTINIAGEKLTAQELRNAVFHGSWVSDAKRYFSKSGCVAYQKGGAYLNGSAIRQDYLQTVIGWISGGDINDYMGTHQHEKKAIELWDYFVLVIDWVEATFPTRDKEMKGLPWGPLYATYSGNTVDPVLIDADIKALRSDLAVKNTKGVYEYVLGGKTDTKLLSIRIFDDRTKVIAYEQQTKKANEDGVSNCPACAMGHDANKDRTYSPDEMDADHVTAWSKGGDTALKNCQMLCVFHNRAKGNR